MREILFKAKRIDTGEWVEGYFYKINEVSYMLVLEEDYMIKIDAKTVCQYTGITDKNGVKIFEGDLVKDTYNTSIDRVYKDENITTAFIVEFNECAYYANYMGSEVHLLSDVYDYAEELEVYENIHNNPVIFKEDE